MIEMSKRIMHKKNIIMAKKFLVKCEFLNVYDFNKFSNIF